jgi:hypothetical protein
MFLWSLADVSASQAQNQVSGTLYINTLDGAVSAWNLQSPNINLVVDYDYQFDGPSGWSSVTFSDDGHHLAYVRTDGDERWVGASPLDEWQPVEFAIDVHFDYEKVQLNWLPNNRYIVASYLIDIPQGPRRPAMYNTLVDRQLLDISNPGSGLINWPYNCSELVVLSPDEPALQCNLNADLGGGNASLPSSTGYDFIRGEMLPHFEGNSTRSFPVQDFIYPNWAWSNNRGIAFFDIGLHELPRGVNLIGLGSGETRFVNVNATFSTPGDLSWSPDGTHLLIRDYADIRNWHIYDISSDSLSTLEIPDLVFQVGVIWFQDSDHIAYVTEEGQQKVVHVASLTADQNFSITLDSSITNIAWRRE